MQTKFYLFLKNHVKESSFLCLCLLILIPIAQAGDVPIERDFLQLPDSRWIWLEKIDVHATKIILGKGKKSEKNKIWSEIRENDGRSTWDYGFFVKLKPNRFTGRDKNGHILVAISTYDIGINMIRPALIFRIKKDRLEFVEERSPFNVAADQSVFPN